MQSFFMRHLQKPLLVLDTLSSYNNSVVLEILYFPLTGILWHFTIISIRWVFVLLLCQKTLSFYNNSMFSRRLSVQAKKSLCWIFSSLLKTLSLNAKNFTGWIICSLPHKTKTKTLVYLLTAWNPPLPVFNIPQSSTKYNLWFISSNENVPRVRRGPVRYRVGDCGSDNRTLGE